MLRDFTVSPATGTAAQDAVLELVDGVRERGSRPRTLGADRGYGIPGLHAGHPCAEGDPHVARKKKHSAIDVRPTRHDGYAVVRNRRGGCLPASVAPNASTILAGR
ncbi:MAG: hypothetical protein OXG36_03345 [Caldilineaceae bacterium]|nr:hypothetical protein [Caldilineaceae bacterium]